MEVLKCLGELIDDKARVNILEDSFRDDVVKVRFHILEQQVHIFVVVCSNGFMQLDYVRVLELFEDFDLSVGALSISSVLECIKDLFESVDSLGGFLFDFPDVSIGARADLFEDGKSFEEVAFDKGGVALRHNQI